jgi:hypothetical protein
MNMIIHNIVNTINIMNVMNIIEFPAMMSFRELTCESLGGHIAGADFPFDMNLADIIESGWPHRFAAPVTKG